MVTQEPGAVHDCIVLGAGGVGAAALYHLARRGARVLGLDRFPPGHDRGSSHGETRIIRQAYFEHPDYVPLLLRACELWSELEERAGARLYHETGLVEIGPADGEVVPGVLASAREHGLEVEELDAAEVERRFRGFLVPEGLVGVFERRAGFLEVERCVEAHIEAARALGAELRIGETALEWRPEGDGVAVRTDRGAYRAARLVIAAGAWARELVDLGVPLVVRRKSLFWYHAREPWYRRESGAPCFLYELPGGGGAEADVFYGFPALEPYGLKIAEHTGGREVADPLAVDRELDPAERESVERFLARHLPGVGDDCSRHAVCLYTQTPDLHFVVDRHPAHPQVAIAAGLSGHGFKFTTVLGEVLADLALEGATRAPIEFLSLARFGSTAGKEQR